MSVYGVKVEEGGVVLRGLGVPFGEWTIVADRDGQLFSEIWDEASITKPPVGIPLLLSHNRDVPPLGVVEESSISKHGLGVEARLVGNDHELEGIRRRLAAGLMTGLSVGFQAGKPQWEKPPRHGMPPGKRVRGAKIVELSLVNYPAFPSAGALSLNQRSARAEQAHEESEKMIAWWNEQKDKRHRESEEIIAWWNSRNAAAAKSTDVP